MINQPTKTDWPSHTSAISQHVKRIKVQLAEPDLLRECEIAHVAWENIPEGLQSWQQSVLWKSDPGLSQSLPGPAHGGAQMTAQQRKPTLSCCLYLPRPATAPTLCFQIMQERMVGLEQALWVRCHTLISCPMSCSIAWRCLALFMISLSELMCSSFVAWIEISSDACAQFKGNSRRSAWPFLA